MRPTLRSFTRPSHPSQKLFGKLFEDDVKYLLSMDKLWEKRRRPTPLQWAALPHQVGVWRGFFIAN